MTTIIIEINEDFVTNNGTDGEDLFAKDYEWGILWITTHPI